MAITSWPLRTSRGTRYVPTCPVAPMTTTRLILGILSTRSVGHATAECPREDGNVTTVTSQEPLVLRRHGTNDDLRSGARRVGRRARLPQGARPAAGGR